MYSFDLSGRSRIKVQGNAVEFLQNICTADIKNIDEGFGVKAAFVDKFGKVVSISSVFNFGDFYLVESDELTHTGLLKHLSGMAEFSGCKITNLSQEYRMFSVIGFEEKFMDIETKTHFALKKKHFTLELLVTKSCLIPRLDFFVPAEASDGFLEFLFRKEGAEEVPADMYEKFRVISGVPEFGKDYTEEYTVMEVSTDCVSYNKGCYIGQEVVARMKTYKGEVPKKVLSLKGSEAKELTKNGEEIGKITSSAGEFHIATLKKPFYLEQVIETDQGIFKS